MGVRLRAGLSVVLLIGFFVLITGLIAGFAGLAIYALATGRLAGIKLVIVAGIVIFAIGGALYKVLKHRPQPHGAAITRAEQPELWQMIDELAVIANTRGPDEIRLVPEVNAAVWEDSKLLGLRPGRRYMEIGLPLLAGLTTSELRAVLGHELGHYSHGHTKYAAVTYRASATMAHTVDGLDGPIGWLMRMYMKLYFLVARSANRAQELQADALAVRAAGKSAARSALGKIPALDMAWTHFNRSYVGLVGQAGRTPDLLLGFNSYLTNGTRRAQLAELQGEMLDAEPASKYDSHPPIRVRIATIEKMSEPDQVGDNRQAWALMRQPERTIPQLESQLLISDLGPRASWEEIVRLAGAAIDKNNAETLTKLATTSGVTRTGSLDEVLTAIEQGKGLVLVSQVLDDDVHPHNKQQAAVEVLTQLVSDTISLALIRSRRAEYQLDWSGPMRLRLTGGSVLNLPELVEPAIAEPAQMPVLREWIARMNIIAAVEEPAAAQQSSKWTYDPSAR
ncbi:M48 family metallopeptidase [Kibdelosporangium aridum]|uniref:Zn-dependent protease with chaperone function n=1 Tax=Kibdelosporangium aridum TaxID=2030 RepID=A0A1W2FXI7_KIBAR|nr:M48 family metallopeptidase [Kibdelosporangium aridum]SMD26635.1 Zn-dependent protease with chaperone function [Kibdelosporangium aridum]